MVRRSRVRRSFGRFATFLGEMIWFPGFFCVFLHFLIWHCMRPSCSRCGRRDEWLRESHFCHPHTTPVRNAELGSSRLITTVKTGTTGNAPAAPSGSRRQSRFPRLLPMARLMDRFAIHQRVYDEPLSCGVRTAPSCHLGVEHGPRTKL